MQHHKQPFEQCLTYSMLRSCSLSQIVYWGAYEQVPTLKLLLKASAVVTSSQHHCQRTHSFQSKARTEESSHLPHSKKEGKGRREERRLNLVTYWNTEKTHRLHVEQPELRSFTSSVYLKLHKSFLPLSHAQRSILKISLNCQAKVYLRFNESAIH